MLPEGLRNETYLKIRLISFKHSFHDMERLAHRGRFSVEKAGHRDYLGSSGPSNEQELALVSRLVAGELGGGRTHGKMSGDPRGMTGADRGERGWGQGYAISSRIRGAGSRRNRERVLLSFAEC